MKHGKPTLIEVNLNSVKYINFNNMIVRITIIRTVYFTPKVNKTVQLRLQFLVGAAAAPYSYSSTLPVSTGADNACFFLGIFHASSRHTLTEQRDVRYRECTCTCACVIRYSGLFTIF